MPLIIAAPASATFAASGMVKSGSTASTSSAAWAQLKTWTADTTNYPGSTVSSDALISQGGKASATISTSIAWTGGLYPSIQVRIKVNDALAVTGATSTTSPSTATVTTTIADGDRITVEIIDNGSYASSAYASITTGATTYVRVV
jgi:hypothetical protein